MKKIEIISATPELLESPFSGSIMKRAIEKGIVEIKFHDLKDYSVNNKKQIDDYQFGGGSGMVLMIEPIKKCIDELKKQHDYDEVIFMTPDAPILTSQSSISAMTKYQSQDQPTVPRTTPHAHIQPSTRSLEGIAAVP